MEQVKFAELLNELGVSADETTVKIREGKAAFDEAWNEYQEALQEYHDSTDPDEKATLMEELNDFEKDLAYADAELVKKITSWNKNKDTWAATRAKMEAGRMAKLGKTPNEAQPQPQTRVQAQPQPQPQTQTQAQPQVEEKEGGDWTWWVIGGLVAVVTLGVGVKYLKRS